MKRLAFTFVGFLALIVGALGCLGLNGAALCRVNRCRAEDKAWIAEWMSPLGAYAVFGGTLLLIAAVATIFYMDMRD